ncbi:uncharacterized protein [Ptychodera flava]|uniref:uncharacterized protein isoform X3 n=1 Tax=Ptychodera flava TaxID=63121 RepID=UPI00396AA63C
MSYYGTYRSLFLQRPTLLTFALKTPSQSEYLAWRRRRNGVLEHREKPFEKLQRVARTVRVVAGICLALKSYVKEGETKQWSLVEMQLNLQADLKDSLAFDINLFKKFRVTRGSEKLKNILLTKPADRTNEDIQVVMALLRKNKTFQEYPTDTQLELIKCMVYQRYEARRIILKQGQRPFAFYIILSGTCLVNIREIDEKTGKPMVRTVREITAGDHFGEIAFMNNSTRTATVVCKDDVELLVLHAEDFNRIIRQPLEQKRDNFIDFCKSLDLFRNWPIDKLRENRQGFTYQYFMKDAVIVENSKDSNSIVIVKTGKCKVVSKIYELKARRRPVSGGQLQSHFPLIDLRRRKEAMSPRSVSAIPQREVPQFTTGSYYSGQSSPKPSKPKQTTSRRNSNNARHLQRPTVPKEEVSTFRNPLLNDFEHERRLKIISTLEMMTGKKITASKPPASPPTPRTPTIRLEMTPTPDSASEESGPSAEKKVKLPNAGVKRTWRRLQIATKSLQLKEDAQRQKPLLVHPSRIRTVYAQIATMSPGAVFGLEQCTSQHLSLISEGCECIIISRKFFISEANSKVLQSISIMTNNFPTSDDTLQEIKRARDWKKYKSRVVRDVVSRTPRNASY